MFVLLEHLDIVLEDRPNLGCAMIMGALEKAELEYHFLQGSTYILKKLFCEMSEGYFDLLVENQDLVNTESSYVHKLLNGTKEAFVKQLRMLYKAFFEEKNLQIYLNLNKLSEITDTVRMFRLFHEEYLKNDEVMVPLLQDYLDNILKCNPDVVGFSMNQWNVFSRRIRMELMKRQIKVIVGGDFTPFFENDEYDGIFKEQKLDYIIVGPGEIAVPELLRAIYTGSDLSGIENLVYRDAGNIKVNHQGAIQDLKQLAKPIYRDFAVNSYFSPFIVLPVQTARGCSYQKCAFCSYHKNAFGTCRQFSLDYVMDIIEELHNEYQCDHFYIHDDDFPAQRARSFCSAVKERGFKDLYFYQYARLDKAYDNEELIRNLEETGFTCIYWGMESGCQKVLDLMCKKIKIPVMEDILARCKKHHIINLCMMILGFPGEDYNDINETVQFLKDNRDAIDILSINLFSLSRHAIIYAQPERWNIVIHEDDTYDCQKGIQIEESAKELKSINEKITSGELKVFSDDFAYYKYPTPYYFNRILSIYYRHKCDLDRNDDFTCIYPIHLGDIVEKDNEKYYEELPLGTRKQEGLTLRKCTDMLEMYHQLATGNNSLQTIIDKIVAGQIGTKEEVLEFTETMLQKQDGFLLHSKKDNRLA